MAHVARWSACETECQKSIDSEARNGCWIVPLGSLNSRSSISPPTGQVNMEFDRKAFGILDVVRRRRQRSFGPIFASHYRKSSALGLFRRSRYVGTSSSFTVNGIPVWGRWDEPLTPQIGDLSQLQIWKRLCVVASTFRSHWQDRDHDASREVQRAAQSTSVRPCAA